MGGMRRLCVFAVAAGLVLAACSGDDDDDATPTTGKATTTTEPGPTVPPETSPNGQPVRTGDYEEVASGDDDGFEWKVLKAPASEGSACWKVETEPALEWHYPFDEVCLPPADPALPRDFVIEFPWASGVEGDFDVVLGIAPEAIESAEFGFSDGSTEEPTHLDEEAGILVWAGPSRPVAAAVEITMADGYRVDCGPGDITSASQLYEAEEAQLLDARQFPWTCLERL